MDLQGHVQLIEDERSAPTFAGGPESGRGGAVGGYGSYRGATAGSFSSDLNLGFIQTYACATRQITGGKEIYESSRGLMPGVQTRCGDLTTQRGTTVAAPAPTPWVGVLRSLNLAAQHPAHPLPVRLFSAWTPDWRPSASDLSPHTFRDDVR